MYKYFRLFSRFSSTSLSAKMIYKANFITEILVEISWALVTIFTLEVMFANINTMAGWSKMDAYFIYGVFRLVSAIFAILFRANLQELLVLVNRGDLDLVLTKPVAPLFYLSLRIISWERFSQLLISIGILTYVNLNSQISWTVVRMFTFAYLICLGVLLRYVISLLIHLLVFWTEKLDNLLRLEMAFTSTARFPRQAMPGMLRHFFTYIIPVMFIAAIPSEIILGKSGTLMVLQMTGLCFIVCGLLKLTFNRALRVYSSASS